MNVAVSRPTRHIPTGRVYRQGAVHEAEPALRALLDGGAEVAGVVTFGPRMAARTSGVVNLEPLAAAHGVPCFAPRTSTTSTRSSGSVRSGPT